MRSRLLFICLLLQPLEVQAKDGARVLVEQAVSAYKAGRFVAAAELFEEAHRQSHKAAPLRNAAKAYEDGQLPDRALDAWQRYLGLPKLSATERGEAKARIDAITAQLAAAQAQAEAERAQRDADASKKEAARLEAEAQARAEADARARAEAERQARAEAEAASKSKEALLAQSPPPARRGWAPWVVVGAGVATAAVGGGLWLHAQGRLDRLDEGLRQVDSAGRITGISRADAQAELSGLNQERAFSVGAWGIGAAAVVGGAIWLLLE